MTKKILVIDDEEWLREMVRLALSQKGFEVVEASDGAAGIELARTELPDLILCDVKMKKMDGYSTLASLREEPATAAIPFILMTGAADNAGMRHGMELGADDYLPKPFTIDGLYGAVEARLKKVDTVRQEAEKKLAHLRDNISLMLPHELRTPLNGILAYGELLASDAASLPAAEIAEMGQVIHASGKRLERLVENFLIYAQLELISADPQKIAALRSKQTLRPGKWIQERAQAQAQMANRQSDLVLELIECPVAISEEYLGKIIDELVQNAFKFSDVDSPVKVTMTAHPQHIALTVSDRGKGLSTEHITRIGAYMQFDRKIHEQQGQGLGLAIAKHLTELHGGTFTLQKQNGGGTVVSAKLVKAQLVPGGNPQVSANGSMR